MRTTVFALGICGLVAGVACSPAEPKNQIPFAPTPGVTTPVTPGVTPVTPGTIPGVTPPVTPGTTPGVTPPVTPGVTPPGVTPPVTPGVTPPVTPTTTGTTPAPVTPTPVATCTGTKDTIQIAENGWVPAECNNFGINGAWYCYDDGVNPSGCTVDTPPYDAAQSGMCLKGNTTEDPDFVAWGAGIGFSLNVVDDVKTAWDADSNHVIGFKIKMVGDTGDLPIRVSYKNSESEDETPPMKELPGVGEYTVLFEEAAVPDWADVNPGDPPITTGIYDIQVQVAGGTSEENYEFCITELTPITDGTEPDPGGTLEPYGQAQSGQYDTIAVGPYVVQNNRYGTNSHSIQALFDGADKAGFVLSGISANVEPGNAPGSYPSLIYGWHVDGKFYGGYQTAKTISSITSAPTTAKITTSTGTSYNASYDLWISGQANPGANGTRTELMVWVSQLSITPIGVNTGNLVDIAGTQWAVWYDDDIGADGFHTVSYIRVSNTRDSSLDLKDFLDDAVSRSYLQASEYLLGVQFGFEIWKAAASDTFSVDEFTVSIN